MNINLSKSLFVVALLATVGELKGARADVIISVSGQSDPYLAGMPDGSTASLEDTAPQQSPIEVSGISIMPGDTLYFSATGSVSYDSFNFNGPDGDPGYVFSRGAENGVAGYTITVNSLLGVFLGPNQPNLSAAPDALDFGTSASRDFLTLSPLLQQPFFIGDGFTSGSVSQAFVIPTGATRLFLGTADGYGWDNNAGSFSVDISGAPSSTVPEPTSFVLLVVGAFGCAAQNHLRQRKSSTCRPVGPQR